MGRKLFRIGFTGAGVSGKTSPQSFQPNTPPTMSMVQEFKEFINKGNVVDLAVGVIMGAAFGKIVGSVVEDIIMPPIGKVLGNLDFSNLYIALSDKITPGMA